MFNISSFLFFLFIAKPIVIGSNRQLLACVKEKFLVWNYSKQGTSLIFGLKHLEGNVSLGIFLDVLYQRV